MKVPTGFNSQAFIELIRMRVLETFTMALQLLLAEVRTTVPVDSGQLYLSIRAEQPEWINFFWIKARVIAGGSDVPQAIWTELGTRAHGPVFAKAMHFRTKGGTEVFTRWVRGVEAMHWMRNATDMVFPQINMLFQTLAAELRATIIVTKTTPSTSP